MKKANDEPMTADEMIEQLGNQWQLGTHPILPDPVVVHKGGSLYCAPETKRGGKFAMSYVVACVGEVEVRGVGLSPELAYASFKRVLFAKTESLQEERKVLDAKLRAAYGLMAMI